MIILELLVERPVRMYHGVAENLGEKDPANGGTA